jgi:hypothetical protein
MLNLKIVLAILVVLVPVGVFLWRKFMPRRRWLFSNAGPTIERLQNLSSLVTLRVPVCDVVDVKAKGFLGLRTRVALIVKGDVEIGTDLSQARLERSAVCATEYTLYLPQPTTRRPRLDHQRTRTYAIDRWWFAPPAPEAVDYAFAKAEKIIKQTAHDEGLLEDARRRTAEGINRFFAELDCVVQIVWIKHAEPAVPDDSLIEVTQDLEAEKSLSLSPELTSGDLPSLPASCL